MRREVLPSLGGERRLEVVHGILSQLGLHSQHSTADRAECHRAHFTSRGAWNTQLCAMLAGSGRLLVYELAVYRSMLR